MLLKLKHKENLIIIFRTLNQHRSISIVLFFLIIAVSILEAFSLALILPIFEIILNSEFQDLKYLPDFVTKNIIFKNKNYLLLTSISFFTFLIFLKTILLNLKNYYNAKLIFSLRGFWMKKFFNLYINFKIDKFEKFKIGTLTNNVVVETEKAQRSIKFFLQILTSFLLSFFLITSLCIISWKITVFLLLITSILLFLFRFNIINFSYKSGKEKIKHVTFVSHVINEILNSIKDTKIFEISKKIKKTFNSKIYDYINVQRKFFFLNNFPKTITELIISLLILFIVFFSITANYDLLDLIPLISVILIIGNRLGNQVNIFLVSIMSFLNNLSSLKFINFFLEEKKFRENLNSGKQILNLKSDIHIKNLNFKYKNKNVFQNLNLVLKKNKINFITGPNGSGKSTLISIILRFYEPLSGEIKLNNHDIKKYNLKSYRKIISYIGQNSILFNDTILNNIKIGSRKAKIKDINKICDDLGLSEFIDKLKDKINTNIGEKGSLLSGGQRQKILFVRSLIKKPRIMILDEFDSAMTENDRIKFLKYLYQKKITTICITHKTKNIKKFGTEIKLK